MSGIELFQAVAAVLYLVTLTVVGIRLLVLAWRNRGLPELYLGASLITAGTFGSTLEACGLGATQEFSPEVVGMLLLSGKLFGLVGLGIQAVFIWKVFRPDEAWGPVAASVPFLLSGGALVAFGLSGTFSGLGIPTLWFWVEFVGRLACPIWLTYESLRYHGFMKRRMQLGLADPVVTNRFLLWAGAGACSVVMFCTSVPPAFMENKSSELLIVDLGIMGLCGVLCSVFYALTFFPPVAYRRLVERRAQEAS